MNGCCVYCARTQGLQSSNIRNIRQNLERLKSIIFTYQASILEVQVQTSALCRDIRVGSFYQRMIHIPSPAINQTEQHRIVHSFVHSFIHSFIHGAESFLRSRKLCSYSRTPQHFMESEVTLPCSQEPSTGP
jgi:hypothetical protein